MKFCPKCGNQLEDNANFCGRCGALLSKEEAKPQQQTQNNYKICPVCGNKVPTNAPTCYVCGADLSTPAAPQAAPAAPAAQAARRSAPSFNAPTQSKPVGEKSTKSLVTGIISVVLGALSGSLPIMNFVLFIFTISMEMSGLILGIIATILGFKKKYKAGMVLGIIGIVLCAITLLYSIFNFVIVYGY